MGRRDRQGDRADARRRHRASELRAEECSLEPAMKVILSAGLAPFGDVVLAQLDIISTASAATAQAASGGAVDPFVFRLSIFVLAVFVGYYVVWSVTPALHTPLMSVTNAISSVIVVGALLAVGVPLTAEGTGLARIFGFVALMLAG